MIGHQSEFTLPNLFLDNYQRDYVRLHWDSTAITTKSDNMESIDFAKVQYIASKRIVNYVGFGKLSYFYLVDHTHKFTKFELPSP